MRGAGARTHVWRKDKRGLILSHDGPSQQQVPHRAQAPFLAGPRVLVEDA